MADDGPGGSGGGNALTQKVGGMPLWAWGALALAAGIAVMMWRQRGRDDSGEAVGLSDNEPPIALAEGLTTEQYESLLAQYRDTQGLLGDIQTRLKDLQGKPSTPVTPTPTKPKPPTPTKPKPKVRTYVVRSGDTLWGISKKHYGTGTKWGTIYNANRYGKTRADGSKGMIKSPGKIYPGWKLVIP